MSASRHIDERRPAAELLAQGTGYLDTGHLHELGFSRRAREEIHRNCPVIDMPGFGRDLIKVEAFVAFMEGHTYCDRCGDRVRPSSRP